MEFARFTLILVLALMAWNPVHCNAATAERERRHRFIILKDSNIGIAVSLGGSIGSGIISSSKFKGRKSFTTDNNCHVKKRRFRFEYDDYGPTLPLPRWTPALQRPSPHY